MSKMEKKDKDGRRSKALFLLVFFLLSFAVVVLGILCLAQSPSNFIQRSFLLFGGILCLLSGALCGVSVWVTLSGKEVLSKSLLSIFIFLLFCLIVTFLLQKTGFFEVIESAESLQEYLKNTGAWMPSLYVLLQFLQVIILPIPSVVSTVAGVALFGAFRAMIYSLIGILIGSFVAFLIGRKLGYRAASWLIGEETLKKWQKKLKGKDQLVLTLMFILPVFPDDVLCLLAGLSTMSTRYFVLIITLSRIFAIASTCYLFDFIPFNTWWGLTVWGVIFAGIILAFVLVYKNFEKLQKIFNRKSKN